MRFIPALAGNTVLCVGFYLLDPVYPRSRGEHAGGDQTGRRRARFIPALAGNTLSGSDAYIDVAVYPRSRGEHHYRRSLRGCVCGLSPLSRGTLINATGICYASRFIPALAGNTNAKPIPPRPFSVYPRSRGEHADHPSHKSSLSRFIPALAGNTHSVWPRGIFGPVYPRSRGEHGSSDFWGWALGGLSPLSRGTHVLITASSGIWRFIPALAGNTAVGNLPPTYKPVYPRSRGEHASLSSFLGIAYGLSPLSRGTRTEFP